MKENQWPVMLRYDGMTRYEMPGNNTANIGTIGKQPASATVLTLVTAEDFGNQSLKRG